MFLAYFALWVILNGRWTLEIGAFGVVFVALLTAFCCKFMGYSMEKERSLARGLLSAVRYGAMLLGEIVKANRAGIGMILDLSFEPQPQLVRFSSGLREERHRVVLADSITLTPGTITCQLEGDDFVVHCLDSSLAEGLSDGIMVQRLREMEQRAEARARKKQEKKAEKGGKEARQ